jgi:hypothetical protein
MSVDEVTLDEIEPHLCLNSLGDVSPTPTRQNGVTMRRRSWSLTLGAFVVGTHCGASLWKAAHRHQTRMVAGAAKPGESWQRHSDTGVTDRVRLSSPEAY